MKTLCYFFLFCFCCSHLATKSRKAVFVIVDGVPADQIERLHTPAIFGIASKGAYGRDSGRAESLRVETHDTGLRFRRVGQYPEQFRPATNHLERQPPGPCKLALRRICHRLQPL